jgi:hypothetical protein
MRTVLEIGVTLTLLGFVGSTAVACGSGSGYGKPAQHLADATGSVGAARGSGAAEDPQAQLHLKLAQDQLEQARGLMKDGKDERASYVLLRAKADADLAVALSREKAAKSAAQKAAADVAAMQSGMPGAGSTTTPQPNTPSSPTMSPPAPQHTAPMPSSGATP